MSVNPKNAGVIVIGNEILSGRTQDLNVAYIGKKLEELGIVLSEVIIIPDLEVEIIDKVRMYSKKYDYVFTTGGIGPTHDDITTASIAKAFDVNVVRSKDAVDRMQKFYKHDQLTEARLKMADIPEGAILINNFVSGAPAFKVENVDNKLKEIDNLNVTLGPMNFDDYIPGWRTAWIKDPDGRIIEVSQGFVDE